MPASLSSQRLCFGVKLLIGYTIFIIAWGAWVRISGSGAGCGEHWPLCNGEAIPSSKSIKTWTEVFHRYSTALFGLAVLMLCLATRRMKSPSKLPQFGSYAVLLFTILEALIGRLLVVGGYVDQDTSLSRMVIMPLHLTNTSLLLFAEVFTAKALLHPELSYRFPHKSAKQLIWGLILALAILLITGGIASLGSHLLPTLSVIQGLEADLNSNSHLAVRLRPLHLVAGLTAVLGIILASVYKPTFLRPLLEHRSLKLLVSLVSLMAILGFLTIMLHAPVYLKIAHLIFANILVLMVSAIVIDLLFRPSGEKS